jgi:hypothetical protein
MNRSKLTCIAGVVCVGVALSGCASDATGADGAAELGASEPVGTAGEAASSLRVEVIGFHRLSGNFTIKTFARYGGLGESMDLPLTNRGILATYGTTGSRLGRFYIDRNRSEYFDPGDTDTRFMNPPQAGDKPFLAWGQKYIHNQAGCVPAFSTGLPIPIMTLMVGVKRGTTFFLDRDGNGVYDPANCDIARNFGGSGEDPVIVKALSGENNAWGVITDAPPRTRWRFDVNQNYTWDSPPDLLHTSFGTDTDYFPPSQSEGLAGPRGRDVYLDVNNSRVWDVGDTRIDDGMAAGDELAGIYYYTVVN